MIITPIRTDVITSKSATLEQIIDEYISTLSENSILVVTSKIVSLCEGAVTAISETSKQQLIEKQAQYILEKNDTKHGVMFTITDNILIPVAGIDESNGDGVHILWPKDPQVSANALRAYLAKRFSLKNVGVIITDSTCSPLRRGTAGIYIAHSGFQALNTYDDKKDLFGKPLTSNSTANIAHGIAAGAVVTMGEGNEQTPLAIVKDVPFVTFQQRDPSEAELKELSPVMEDDIFAPFLTNVAWKKGNNRNAQTETK